MNIRFQTPYQYVFIHEDIKHLLLLWRKKHKWDLYIIEEEKDGEMTLRFPGETYIEMVLKDIEPIFFQRLETPEKTFLAILGATFTYEDRTMLMYYDPEYPEEAIYFFERSDEGIAEIDEAEYEQVVQTFINEFPEYFKDYANV
ncbi:hypothetical protein [Thermoactinomyces mirandus]|uniref:Uncharacterized protein n=1 Tax=Thermoactinomyces mirandus TaxID=2756294 RepID=A0A7W1XSL7_9BACL|nr:hypothetical protein [Thermoactinomyces mirandus]MBA4602518.1 hypothetical protein [Thermoactinomyces mirandus]